MTSNNYQTPNWNIGRTMFVDEMNFANKKTSYSQSRDASFLMMSSPAFWNASPVRAMGPQMNTAFDIQQSLSNYYKYTATKYLNKHSTPFSTSGIPMGGPIKQQTAKVLQQTDKK